MSRVGIDQGILTREEVKYIEEKIVEQVHEKLLGRQLFPIERIADAGYMDYKYYEEIDMGEAAIGRYGTAQADDKTLYAEQEVTLPEIWKTFMIQRRDILASRHQGPSLLEQYPRNAARQVAEEEDKLLLTGEYTGWAAMGIQGLLTAATSSAAASGAWPANAIADINTARIALENLGFIGSEGILIARPAVMKCLDRQLTNTDTTYRKFLLNNDLIRDSHETRNLFSATGGADSALLVIPGRENFYMVEAEAINTSWWYDKMGNAYGVVREVVAPVIARPDAIYEITGITCS